jgi:hypothetical protein
MKRASRILAVTIGLLAFGLLPPAEAQRDKQPPAGQPDKRPVERQPVEFGRPPRPGMRVSLDILVDGKPMPVVQHQGKTYLPVPKLGVEYAIRVANEGPRRVVAIVSVDGLSVMNGQPASEEHTGYIVAPGGNIVIKGWRRNMDTVAAFAFVEREKSYAALMGRPENVGVIGLVAIEELAVRPQPLLREDRQLSTAQKGKGEVGNTGTGYGRDVDSRIYYVPFVRSNNKRTITIYYDTVEALRKAGVPVDRPTPVPFPRDSEFAPPPPGDPRK